MFNQASIFLLDPSSLPTFEAMQAALAQLPFQPCSATQELSVGWVPPRGQAHAALVESVQQQWLFRLQVETKRVPAAALKRALQERLAQIEASSGRQPGRREQRQLRDELLQALLPQAFAQSRSLLLWLDPLAGRLVIDCASSARTDLAIDTLAKTLPGLRLSPWQTTLSPQAAMTAWLCGTADAWPTGLAPGQEVELKAPDEPKSVVRFARHPLLDEQMRLHIGQGKLPTRLALDWDGRLRGVLQENGTLTKLALHDDVLTSARGADERSAGDFDTDVAIICAELGAFITDLTAALGGLLKTPTAPLPDTPC